MTSSERIAAAGIKFANAQSLGAYGRFEKGLGNLLTQRNKFSQHYNKDTGGSERTLRSWMGNNYIPPVRRELQTGNPRVGKGVFTEANQRPAAAEETARRQAMLGDNHMPVPEDWNAGHTSKEPNPKAPK